MPPSKRKKPPKFDHVELQQSFVARPPTEAEARTATQAWLAVEENIERLLEAVASGQSVRRFCEREQISYSPVQRALTSPALESRYHEAQLQQGEHLLGEMERITGLIEDGTLDAKAGSVILDSLKWRMSKFNARYNDRQVIEQHQFNHTQAHIAAVRQLARMTSVVQIGDGHARPALVHQTDRTPIHLPVPLVAPEGVVEEVVPDDSGVPDAPDASVAPVAPDQSVAPVRSVAPVAPEAPEEARGACEVIEGELVRG